MSEKEKIYIFDDGSLESKLLQYELKDKYDIKAVGVNVSDNLLECFTKIQPDRKVHLHYTYEEYAADHEQLRKDIQKVQAMGFKNLVVLDYEGLDEKTMRYRAKAANLLGTEKPYKEEFNLINTMKIQEDIKLTGKPVAIAIDDKDEKDKSIKPKTRKKFVPNL